MPRRQSPLPRLWLMTDERMGADFIPTLRRLPKGAGVVFRHYRQERAARGALLGEVRRIARARRLMLLVGGHDHRRGHGAISAPVHSIVERIAAERAGAKMIFVSPVFATASHPDARPLGRVRFGLLIRNAKVPIIALGGMDAKRARSLKPFGIHGWAGIDAFVRQKRKAVPT